MRTNRGVHSMFNFREIQDTFRRCRATHYGKRLHSLELLSALLGAY